MTVLTRLASPAGFGLALLLFLLLPFLSVSCDVPDAGPTGVTYTGTHLVTGGQPPLVVPEEVDDLLAVPDAPGDEVPATGVRAIATVLAAVAVAGVLAGLAPWPWLRRYGGGALAVAALALTAVTLLVARANVRAALLPRARELADGTTSAPPDERLDASALLDGVVHVEWGFWLVTAVLALVAAHHGHAIVRSRRPPAAAREP